MDTSVTKQMALFGEGESSALLESVDRLEQLILSNSGEDAFLEVLKLLFAKLHDEHEPKSRFAQRASETETHTTISELFEGAKSRWPHVFTDDETFRAKENVIHLAASELAPLHLRSTSLSILDASLEKLVSRTSKGSMGQFFTPRNVIEFCVDVLSPRPDEVVMDPACGSAAFLLAALKSGAGKCVGFDFDAKAYRVARMMAAVTGNDRIVLSRRNSLELDSVDLDGDTTFDEQFGRTREIADVIVTNPPFGGDINSRSILDNYSCAAKHYVGRLTSKMPAVLVSLLW